MRYYGIKGMFESRAEYIEMLASSFVDEWLEAYEREGSHVYLFEPRQLDVVKAWETILNAEGYKMVYDADEECFWLTSNGDRTEAPVPFYY